MKKIIFLSLFLLTSCFSGVSEEEIQTAKSELLGSTQTGETQEDIAHTGGEIETSLTAQQKILITPLDSKEFIHIDDLGESDINEEEIAISGTTQSGGVDSITVQFSNAESSFPLDSYVLQNYKRGDLQFTYNASARQKVLDFGKNEYLFTAKSGDQTSQVKVEIYLDKNEESRIQALQSTGSGEILSTGTNIAGLTLLKEDLIPLDCSQTDAITEFLLSKYSWAYWNTCRDVVKEKSIVYNVLRLEGEKYMYERHYYDFSSGQYGVLTLETGTGVDKSNMGDKNKELKAKDFTSVSKDADDYFKNL